LVFYIGFVKGWVGWEEDGRAFVEGFSLAVSIEDVADETGGKYS